MCVLSSFRYHSEVRRAKGPDLNFKKLSSRLFRSLGAATAVSLLAGLLVSIPTEAQAAETANPYSFSISADRSLFYTNDATPRITVDPGTVPPSMISYAQPNMFYLIDLDAKKVVNWSGDLKDDWKIQRFFSEKEKHFKSVFAADGQQYSSLDELTGVLAESNEITIKRGGWELTLTSAGYPDHVGNEQVLDTTTNQYLRQSWVSDPEATMYYDVYVQNLNTGRVTQMLLPDQYNLKSSSPRLEAPGENETVRYQAYVAKKLDGVTVSSFDQLQEIQAKSNVLVVPPRPWGVQIEKAEISSSQWSYYVAMTLKLNRTVKFSESKGIYVENTDTGDLTAWNYNSTYEGDIYMSPSRDAKNFIVHIADKGQAVTKANELKNIVASSNGEYPVSQTAPGTNFSKHSQFQNGSNPSTADCNQQCKGDPVNSFNGELFENDSDLEVEGAIGLNFVRSSSSFRTSEIGAFGPGTTFSYNMALKGNRGSLGDSNSISVRQENGSTVAFTVTEDSDGKRIFDTAPSIRAELSEEGSGYVFLRTKTQERFHFNSSGRLLKISDRLGNEVDLNYDSSRLTSVSNGVNTLAISWSGDRISTVNDGSHSVSYEYDAENRLVKVSKSSIPNPKLYSYYPDGRIRTITHPNGGTYETVYGDQGRVVSQKDPRGGITSFEATQNYSGYITATITLPSGEKTRENYNALGQLNSRVFAFGTEEARTHSYTYSGSGEMTSEILPGESGYTKKITYSYDSRGNLSYIANPAGEFYRFEYNKLNLLTTTVNPAGRESTNEYSESGVLLRTVGFDGSITSYSHNSKGMLTSLQDPNGQQSALKTRYSYNGSDLLSSTTDTRGKSTSYEYDGARNPVKITDELGDATSFSYANDNSALPREIVYPNGSKESFSYDGAGRKIKEVARDGSQTEYSYDQMDNLLTVTDAYGITSYEYDANQKLIATVNPKGARTEYRYNALGMPVETKLPGGRVSTNEYNASGLLSAQKDAAGNRTAYSYDSAGRVLSVTDPASKVTGFVYNRTGDLIQKTLPSGNWIKYGYDAESRLVSTNEKDLRKTSYGYDSNGNLLKTTYGDGSFELRSYDSENNLIGVTARDGKKSSYSYDGLNRLSKETRTDGTEVVNGYDSMGNMVSSDYGDGYIYENSYNLKGQLTSAKTPEGLVTEYGYNPAGDLTSRGPPQSKVSYDYNSFGEVTGVNYPSGAQIAYSYDSMGMLETVKSGADTLASYSYDSRYNLNSSSFGNGVTETNEFDGLNRLNSITAANDTGELYKRNLQFDADSQISRATTNYSGGIKQDRSYQYNALGTISSVKDELTAKSQSFGYDLLNNLKTLGSNSYLYRANSSELATSVVGGLQFHSYDQRGNRTQSQDTLLGTTSTYSWTKSNQLKSTAVRTQSSATNRTISYGYDAEGLLASRANTAPLTKQDKFSWDTASNSIPVLIEDGSYEYIYGAEATPFLQISKSSGERTYLHGDERNSVVLATNNTGQPLWYRNYDEYGSKYTKTVVPNAVATPETRFGYAGEYLDPDTGLYLLRARWYDPKTAAFLSTDPAVLSTGESHSYASGNPLSYTDPLGLWSNGDTANVLVGVVDGFIGFPLAADIANRIAPGGIDKCSNAYRNSSTVAEVGSLFIPGMGPIKAATTATKFAIKATKVVSGKATQTAAREVTQGMIRYGTTIAGNAVKERTEELINRAQEWAMEKYMGRPVEEMDRIKINGKSYLKYGVHPQGIGYAKALAYDVIVNDRYGKIQPYTIEDIIENGGARNDWMTL